ncbi:IQ motif and ubiquitin-like domain-containing protein [Babylonia areolata]|uniref:IQ motif and ubiquitin-like domain-containing protein n=1 Tax=Babylonia areolata TaxID=304850 RepID=UPI003FD6BD80
MEDEVNHLTPMDAPEQPGEAPAATGSKESLVPGSETAHPPSPSDLESPVIKEIATATVKVILMPAVEVVTMAFALSHPLRQMKSRFASKFRFSTDFLLLLYEGKEVADTSTLADLGVGPNSTVQLEMHSSDPASHPIGLYRAPQEQQMPDVITVRVDSEDGKQNQVVVEIERRPYRKPYLGGFQNKLTGVRFYNAGIQTDWIPTSRLGPDNASCRDSQTAEQRHLRQQTFTDTSTQMTGVGVYVSNLEDKLLDPGKYTLAEDHLNFILQKIIILQKNYRRWLAVKKVERLKEAKRKRLEWEEQERQRKQKERDERLWLEFERKMHPKTKKDFDLLYAALEKWRLEEIEHINQTLSGAERKAALYMLLERETDLLAAIDRHKLESGAEELLHSIQKFLNRTSAPKKWRGFDNKPTMMVTPYTLRAKELRDIYNTLNMKYLSQDERLDILLTLKFTVSEHDCTLTQDIVELIDREVDLVIRNVKDDHLFGLRKRISTLFLQYIKTPAFNPEAANFIRVPQDPSKLRKNIHFCPSCNKYLPTEEFHLSTNSRSCGSCRRCQRLDNIARPRLDLSHFRRMLKSLRMSEEAKSDGSQIAFIMQEKDIRYLVEYIWAMQSVLSAWKDPHDLVLIRWDSKVHWSPWNCIVLTSEEAESHAKVDDLHQVYDEAFHNRLHQKHVMGYKYFCQLPGILRKITAAAIMPSSTEKSKYLPPNMVNKVTQTPEVF